MLTRLFTYFDDPLTYLLLGMAVAAFFSGLIGLSILISMREDQVSTKIEEIGHAID